MQNLANFHEMYRDFFPRVFVSFTCCERAPGITSNDTSKSARSKLIRRNVKYYTVKGTVRPDWICMVPLESPLKGHQPLYVFDFLISVLNI